MSRLRRTTLATLVVLLPCTVPEPARAAWPHDPDVNVPICTSPVTHQNLVSCPDGAGGAIIAWSDARTGNYDIYAQRVDRNGVTRWTADGLGVCTAATNQLNPVLCVDDRGGAIVAWSDSRSGNNDIYVQRIDASGVPQWTANGVALCTATSTQAYPAICPDGSGGAIVAWADNRNGNYDIYVRRVNSSGTPQWTSNGVALCTATLSQTDARIVVDGSGGAIVAWVDYRSGNNDLYARRVNSSGTAQWTANGNVVCNEASAQSAMEMVEDGGGGAILAWTDARTGAEIYAQRLDDAGTEQWTANGVLVCTTSSVKAHACLVADGEGGAIVAWEDFRNGVDDNIYAQRLKATGALQWNAAGVTLCAATGFQEYPQIASDGAGGAVVVWTDGRNGKDDVYARRVSAAGTAQWTSNGVAVCTNRVNLTELAAAADGQGGVVASWGGLHDGADAVYAQRVDRFGEIGSPEPTITGITDVAGDQGGQVVVEWTASYRDADPGYDIYAYSIWRQVPASGAQARAFGSPSPEGTGGRRALRTTTEGAQTVYWEYMGSQPARAREGYSFVAPTTTDSMPGSNLLTRFMVSAEEYGGVPYWDSAPDSGYSVDNLAPPTPAPFTGQYSNGTTTLQWGTSPAPDFAAFQLYRGQEAGFVPGAGNLVATLTTGGYTDAAGGPYYYKLCAVDVHGNASPYAALLPSGALDVPGAALPRELALSAPAPNPVRGSTTLRLALPRAARVALAVFDQQGRRVRALLSGAQPAGEHAVAWDGRNEGGRAVPSGMYFVRCEVEGRTFTRRIAAVR